ncbi:RagB/SusD family nutrient uptake outer membrane protein [Aestuariibaculum sp. M13]|uniref:RagB/SusD family nutrient uptake outer membrane protein n=1 Tax=Aestuariibaculum sp. M13 TaxID=2967132 RepID=UPI002159EE3F|nr:RagB/SusD family nutrient uptake outer membrane protein [Aestuariibaculum sp. M13]MCR8668239.1 RagB/SusD family nutrient uptake outer membrane protein [Aestuariibaculum sp. M13]
MNTRYISKGVLFFRKIESNKLLIIFLANLTFLSLFACEEFLEIDPPKDTLITETVYEDISTVKSAMANVFYKIREEGLVTGNFGMSINMGIYSDELDYYGFDLVQQDFYNHNIIANNSKLEGWWNSTYNLIYAANDIIYGLENSKTLSEADTKAFKGQAFFIRGYMHSLLVGLFGDIPYVTSTNYETNNEVERGSENQVYEYIIQDLQQAISFMDPLEDLSDNIMPHKETAQALLARVYLYRESWNDAIELSTSLINSHSLEMDVEKVFLKESKETLWQLKSGDIPNTYEAGKLVINYIPSQGYGISDALLNAFESNDLRKSKWIQSFTSDDGLTTLYYAAKYKETINTTNLELEYSIVFRLSEQYLIRAEAKAQLGDLEGAISDIEPIRQRAGLPSINVSSKEEVLEAIHHERQVELFTEHGLRWFDLVRSGKASEELSPLKSAWKDTDILLPLPESELELNPNLKPQNLGY